MRSPKQRSNRILYARLQEASARLAVLDRHIARVARNPAAIDAQRWEFGNHVAARALGIEGEVPFSLSLVGRRIRQAGALRHVGRMSELVRLEVGTTGTLTAHELTDSSDKATNDDSEADELDEVLRGDGWYEDELPPIPEGQDKTRKAEKKPVAVHPQDSSTEQT